jgi:hypothetical protein
MIQDFFGKSDGGSPVNTAVAAGVVVPANNEPHLRKSET